jgi:hypothetical protein
MKTPIKITFIVLGTLGVLFSCTPSEPPTSSELYFAKDVTASAENKNRHLKLSPEKLISLLDLDSHPMALARYSHSLLTEVSLNEEFSEELKSIIPSEYNPYRRNAQIKAFTSKIGTALKNLENAEYDRPSSNIFLTLSEIINKVAKRNATRQVVIVQSDVLDNSYMFSAYNKAHLKKVENSPEFISKILEQYAPIQSIPRMKIIIVYQPSIKTDYIFRLISKQYKAYLESKGATVEIVANL